MPALFKPLTAEAKKGFVGVLGHVFFSNPFSPFTFETVHIPSWGGLTRLVVSLLRKEKEGSLRAIIPHLERSSIPKNNLIAIEGEGVIRHMAMFGVLGDDVHH